MQLETYLAPAKLNLFLHIVGRQTNGYHLLQSLFTKINLYDELQIEVAEINNAENIIKVNTFPPIENLVATDNLCYKAAKQILTYVQNSQQNSLQNSKKFSITINLTKNIPNGAGLGGGSSDAAMVLKILNNKLNLHLNETTLLQIAKNLGADIPFFIKANNHYFVEGIGEKLTEFTDNKTMEILNNMYYLILKDTAISIPTPLIYQAENLQRNSAKIDLVTLENDINNDKFFDNYAYQNNLEMIVLQLFPELQNLKSALQNLCKTNIKMTGSGSALFISSTNKQQLISLLELIENAEKSKKIPQISWKKIVEVAKIVNQEK